jgi:DnaJ like chaperone protein
VADDGTPLSLAERDCLDALKAWRGEVARAHNLPAYVIFHDATLAAIAERNPATLEDLLDALWMIAAVDGFHEAELAFLGEVATILGFDEAAQARIRRRHLAPAADDPWAVLGVEPGADAAALRAAYHALVKRYHPDRALAEGVPSEFIRVSELRMADINAAYDRLTGRRR